jgi:hypothetical protein
MELFINAAKGNGFTCTTEGPDQGAIFTLILRGGTNTQILETLQAIVEYAKSRDLRRDTAVASMNKHLRAAGFRSVSEAQLNGFLTDQSMDERNGVIKG